MKENKTTTAWKKLDAEFDIQNRLADNEIIELTAKQISEISGREPRLMTKFDEKGARPEILANATVLPVTNGDYRIFLGDGYHKIEGASGNTKIWRLPQKAAELVTFPWEKGAASESQAIDMAYLSGVLSDFLQDESLFLTIRGRLRSPEFVFDFKTKGRVNKVKVSGVQIEVDAGFEGKGIHLVEAKMGHRDNFHIRQLYYPFRMWSSFSLRKPISTVFLSYSDRVFSLRKYGFESLQNYHSIALLAAQDYVLDEKKAGDLNFKQTILGVHEEAFPGGVPFPQADDLRKVMDAVDAVSNDVADTSGFAETFDFTERQADYYRNAAAFLGFMARDSGSKTFKLTELGRKFSEAPRQLRHQMLLQRLMALPVFRQGMRLIIDKKQIPDESDISNWLTNQTGYSRTTVLRRVVTVRSWLQWALTIVEANFDK